MEKAFTIQPRTETLDRHKNLSPKDFLENYVVPGKPVILTEAALKWPAMKKWTPEFFKTKYGHIEREALGRKYKMAEYMDLMMHSTDEKPAPYPYKFNMEFHFPELLADAQPQIAYGKTDRLSSPLMPKAMLHRTHVHELFFGGKGAIFPLHFDAMFMHTQITQIYGDKVFYLYPPEDSDFLYPKKDNFYASSVENIFNADIEKYPLFAKAKPYVETVKQGETLFFPTHWWHTTWMPGPSITYGRAHLNGTNWNNFMKDFFDYWKGRTPVKSRILYVYGTLLGVYMDLLDKLK